MKIHNSLFVISISLVLSACTFNNFYVDRVEDKNEAEKTANRYYDYLKNKNYDASETFFGPEFWKVTSKEKIKEMDIATQKKLGDLQSVKLDHWSTKVVEGSNPSAEYLLYYANKYQNYEAKETLRLVKEHDGTIKIIAFNINSDGFFK